MNDTRIRQKIVETVEDLWFREIRHVWPTYDCNSSLNASAILKSLVLIFGLDVFDLILTRDLNSGHVIDFNPFAEYTDALLFTYEDLWIRFIEDAGPLLLVVDSRSHEAANRSSPANVHNRVPFEMLSMSSGQSIEDFARNLENGVRDTMDDT